jgi:hypothetical protein
MVFSTLLKLVQAVMPSVAPVVPSRGLASSKLLPVPFLSYLDIWRAAGACLAPEIILPEVLVDEEMVPGYSWRAFY